MRRPVYSPPLDREKYDYTAFLDSPARSCAAVLTAEDRFADLTDVSYYVDQPLRADGRLSR